jgi:tetratricopeptide (TPR) repeat protein
MWNPLRLITCVVASSSCITVTPTAVRQTEPSAPTGSPLPAMPPPLLEGLGNFTRTVSHVSPEGQRWFDQGLKLVYGFNHDEAVKAFIWAGSVSPECAMCFWGLAYALGPHINDPTVSPSHAKAATEAVQKAQTLAKGAGPVEQALIAALATRYATPQPEDRGSLDTAYANAMREVFKQFPHDADVAALTAEALMDLHPWDYWAGGESRPWTQEIVQTAEAALRLAPQHPLANHVLIHALEASPQPALARGAADTLRALQPGLGHMVHMPSHIDVLLGDWDAAIEANRKAIAADDAYRALVPDQKFYSVYMMHNHQMLGFAAMMSGRGAEALQAMTTGAERVPPSFVKEAAPLVDGYFALPLEVQMRFGKWDEILAAPQFDEALPASRAFRHAARGIAYAAKGDLTRAREEQQAFLSGRAKVPEGWLMGVNPVQAVFDVAEHLLAGEILYRQKKTAADADQAFAELRKAVAAEDALKYDEPPDWMQPVRHAFGAALTQSKRFAEAEVIFREDLVHNPGNGWALFGLAQALRLQGTPAKKSEALEVEAQFKKVWGKADVTLHSACLCQPGW